MNSGRGENLDVAEWLCKIHCIIVTLSLCQYMMHAMKFLDEIFDLLFQLLKRRMNANEENILMQNLHRRLIFWCPVITVIGLTLKVQPMSALIAHYLTSRKYISRAILEPLRLRAFHLYGKTRKNFSPKGTVQLPSAFPGKSNETILSSGNFGKQIACFSIAPWFFDNSRKNEKRSIPPKVFLFFENFPIERTVPFYFPPEQTGFYFI